MMRDFSMHVLDIAQNSIRAEAKLVTIEIVEDEINNRFAFTVEDDGFGMSAEMLRRVRDPFTTSRTTRKVGLGIPMLEQTCQMCGGGLDITSTEGVGTKLTAYMLYDSIDRPPLGDIEGSMHILLVTNTGLDFKYIHRFNEKVFELDTREIKEVLGGVPLDEPEVSAWVKENIAEGLAEIRNK
jgi:hypothetical protein